MLLTLLGLLACGAIEEPEDTGATTTVGITSTTVEIPGETGLTDDTASTTVTTDTRTGSCDVGDVTSDTSTTAATPVESCYVLDQTDLDHRLVVVDRVGLPCTECDAGELTVVYQLSNPCGVSIDYAYECGLYDGWSVQNQTTGDETEMSRSCVPTPTEGTLAGGETYSEEVLTMNFGEGSWLIRVGAISTQICVR